MSARSVRRDRRWLDVDLRGVSLAYGDTRVLRQIRWRIRPGERWVLAGDSGAGKTQLLKIIAGDVWPAPSRELRQHYRWHGELQADLTEVKAGIAYLGPERQDRYERNEWNHPVTAVVGTGLQRSLIPEGRLNAGQRRQVASLLRRLGIAHLARRRFLGLSFGERHLVLLARALAWRPALLLLDEVGNGLDAANRARLQRFLAASERSRMPWVLTTHRAEDIPAAATHLACLRAGRLVCTARIRKPAARRAAIRRAFGGTAARVPASAGRTRSASADTLIALRRANVWLEGRRILAGLDFSIEAGDCWVVHGANGAGKSTLLRTLYGTWPVDDRGSLVRLGVGPGVPLDDFRRWTAWIAPQLQSGLPRDLGVLDTVGSGLHASIGLNESLSAAERRRARRVLVDFGLERFAARELRQLSYGQLRRVLFARAWILRPRLLLLDEPYAGVDTRTRAALMRRVEVQLAAGASVVIATHHRTEWPAAANHELELAQGRPLYCGPVRA